MFYDQWAILNPDYKEGLPDDKELIYYAVINKRNNEIILPVDKRIFCGPDHAKSWYKILEKLYGEDAIIVWHHAPEAPKLPEKWKIVFCHKCTSSHACQFNKHGHCKRELMLCPHQKSYPEFQLG